MVRKFLLVLLMLLVPTVLLADELLAIYMHKDANGTMVFTDKPTAKSKRVSLDPLTVANKNNPKEILGDADDTEQQSATANSQAATVQDNVPQIQYRSLEAYQPNTPLFMPYVIHYIIRMNPSLDVSNHMLILLDGKPIIFAAKILPPEKDRNKAFRYVVPPIVKKIDAETQDAYYEMIISVTTYDPENLEAGNHTWQVQVMDSKDNVLKQSSVQSFSVLWKHNNQLVSGPSTSAKINFVAKTAFTVLFKVARSMISPI